MQGGMLVVALGTGVCFCLGFAMGTWDWFSKAGKGNLGPQGREPKPTNQDSKNQLLAKLLSFKCKSTMR